MKTVELRRHTAAENDVLTSEGVRAALEIGARLAGEYVVAVSSGAQRATQTLACFLAGRGARVTDGVIVGTGFRSENEAHWFEIAREAGGELKALLDADREFVEKESAQFADALRRVLELLPEGGRALVVGHSPMNECAVFGLTGTIVEPISKGGGVLVIEEGGRFTIEGAS
jgi:broad specificity phosphatase PhoE